MIRWQGATLIHVVDDDLLVERKRKGLTHLQTIEGRSLEVEREILDGEGGHLMEALQAARIAVAGPGNPSDVILACPVVSVSLLDRLDKRTAYLGEGQVLAPGIGPVGV